MEQQKDAHEASVKVACVSPMHFYSLLVKGEFVVVDLGTAEQFARGRLMGAQHLPEGTSSFVDDFGYERRDKLLAYTHLPSDRITPTDPRLAIFHKQKYLKEILILEGGADAFAKQYPFLRVGGGADAFLVYPSQILPSPSGLFLGSQITTTNRQVLQDLKITHIVNVTNEVLNEFEFDEALGIAYHRCCVMDEVTEDIFRFFYQTREFIDRARSGGGNVLVHCAQGRSRSATIVTAYLMLTNRWDFETAYSHVTTLRDIVRVNPGFRRQLLTLEAEITNSTTDDDDTTFSLT
ncbi:dual specificity phosphatase, putative [Acanthamoeba castellanii str. Neff]|uniref:protein-tyrosine-phosphatase n=1 Tax=Acanthamoeba castellanii (strain ATCC 30010 / Neff) TaxID=1257118 RepID=L8GYG8_ACACF|nr:dual specificity phosphatase, putative [Acanthamoeba castellanii str. Neff]ELR17126.1 dual specificity phosphatase, putative [Acanthamoeba castellanii str. Neff]